MPVYHKSSNGGYGNVLVKKRPGVRGVLRVFLWLLFQAGDFHHLSGHADGGHIGLYFIAEDYFLSIGEGEVGERIAGIFLRGHYRLQTGTVGQFEDELAAVEAGKVFYGGGYAGAGGGTGAVIVFAGGKC